MPDFDDALLGLVFFVAVILGIGAVSCDEVQAGNQNQGTGAHGIGVMGVQSPSPAPELSPTAPPGIAPDPVYPKRAPAPLQWDDDNDDGNGGESDDDDGGGNEGPGIHCSQSNSCENESVPQGGDSDGDGGDHSQHEAPAVNCSQQENICE